MPVCNGGLEKGNFQYSGGVRVYALSVRKTIDPLLLEEEGPYVLDIYARVEAKLLDGLTARSARAGFVVTSMTTGAD